MGGGKFLAGLTAVLATSVQAEVQTVVGGPGNDYQAAVIVPWAQPQQRIAVFERLNVTFSGDLWLTRSDDDGEVWTEPSPIVISPANERHASLVQTGADAYLLLYVSNATGGYRIHRATSSDGSTFTGHEALDLGWASAGELNPQVLREPDGGLILVYHRIGGAAYLARSDDDGASWDALRTQISPGNAALPRLAYDATRARYLLAYQTNPGDNQLRLWLRTSADPYLWTDTPLALADTGNNHDPWPLVLDGAHWLVFWTRVVDGSFQIQVRHSSDGGLAWSPAQQLSDRPGLANVQPYALPAGRAGQVELYWGAAQQAGNGDYDIVRVPSLLVVDAIFADDFESYPDGP